ncbi:hypothetical protein Tco_1087211 [Tanacetum coccineum]
MGRLGVSSAGSLMVSILRNAVVYSGQSGTLVKQGSAVIVTANADFLSRMSADHWARALMRGSIFTMVAACKTSSDSLQGELEALWKMRIEPYFLMTYYALWEVIVNGDSPPPKITVDGVEQTYPPTTVEYNLARKNKLKARGTFLIALPNEH